jgi:hypothetical protein
MPRWEIVGGPFNSERGWTLDCAHGNERVFVTVEVAASVDAVGELENDESRRAIRSHGRTAVDKFADWDDLPRRIVVTTTGVVAATDDDG